MDHTAFALREEYTGTAEVDGEQVPVFQGGVLAIPPDSRSFDVAAKLAEGDGAIVVSTSNAPLVELLRHYPPLKEVAAPEGAIDTTSYADWTVSMLRDELERRSLSRAGTKDELRDRLEKADAGELDNDDQDGEG